MAVALREGLEVKIITNGFNVIPKLEPSALDPNVKALVFYIEDTGVHEGTTVMVNCTVDELEQAKASFAVLSGVDQEAVKKNTIVDGVKNTVFVNGVKVTEYDSIFSYNFTNADLMNRDRTTADITKVKKEVAKLLTMTKDSSIAAVVLDNIVGNDKLLESQAGISGWGCYQDVWKSAIPLAFGTDKLAIATGRDSDTQARYKRYTLLTGIPSGWRYFFNTILEIPYSDELTSVVEPVVRKHVKPKGDESVNLGWAKRLIKLYYGDYGTVKISEKVIDEFNNECNGLYDSKNDVTWLKRSILDDKEKTFKVLLHETVHRLTGADDNTEDFTRGLEHAAWMILTRGKGE